MGCGSHRHVTCPVQAQCVASHAGTQTSYPVKTRKLKRGTREHLWLWLAWRDRIWLVQRPDRGVWAGLWSLPEFDSTADFESHTEGWPGRAEVLPSFTHVLTHLDWTLHPRRWTLPANTSVQRAAGCVAAWPTGRWFSLDEALAAGLPAPLRKLLSG